MPCTSLLLPHWFVVHSYRGGNRGSEGCGGNKLWLPESLAFSHPGLQYTCVLKPQAQGFHGEGSGHTSVAVGQEHITAQDNHCLLFAKSFEVNKCMHVLYLIWGKYASLLMVK